MGLPGSLMWLSNAPATPAGPAGFGGFPGFGLSLGLGQQLNTWNDWPFGIFGGARAGPGTVGMWAGRGGGSAINRTGYIGPIFGFDNSQSTFLAEFWGTRYVSSADGAATPMCPGDVRVDGGAANWAGLFGGNACQSALGSFTIPFATGHQSKTSLGFTDFGSGKAPDVVIFLGTGPPGGAQSYGYSHGIMSASSQWCSSAKTNPGTGSTFFGGTCGQMERSGGFFTDRVIHLFGAPPCAQVGVSAASSFPWDPCTATFVSMDNDGFTIDWTAVDTTGSGSGLAHTLTMYFMALKADPARGSFGVGNFTQPAANVAVGFDPDAVWIAGQGCNPADPNVSLAAFMTVGGTDGTHQRGQFNGSRGGGGLGPPNHPAAYWGDSMIICGDPESEVIGGRADATLVPGGFNLNWTTDDGGLRKFGYLAWQLQSAPAAAPIVTTLPASSLTRFTALLNGEIVPNSGFVVLQYQFFWRVHGGGPFSTTPFTNDGSGAVADFVSALLAGLTPGVEYDFYLEASVDGAGRYPAKGGYGTVCTYDGSVLNFTTPNLNPVFHTRFRSADDVGSSPAPHYGFQVPVPVWQPSTFAVFGSFITPDAPNGHTYQCYGVGGTTDVVEPTWSTSGGTVSDGSTAWKDIGTAFNPVALTWSPLTSYGECAIVQPPNPNGSVYVVQPFWAGTSGAWPFGGQADPWTAPYDGTDSLPAGVDWPTGYPSVNSYSGLDGSIYWLDLGPGVDIEPGSFTGLAFSGKFRAG